ncbi:MAG: hypothetical protein A4E70_01067 [Syntrophus sp. PtaU1.Bin005]|nr:MAG: hypothetical protein A4E70_01067 [Syntrophus sp. PtaU1.Bin005]
MAKALRKEPSSKLIVYLEFSKTGYLKVVSLNAATDTDQVTLERALHRILKPIHLSWIRRLFKR